MGTVMNESRRQILLDTPHTETATGAIASFETDMVGRAKEVKVEIEPVQEGTPWIADTTESVPYNFRAVKGTAPRIGNSIFESVVGGTVVWNQIAEVRGRTTVNGVSMTNNGDGSATISGTATANTKIAIANPMFGMHRQVGHKILLRGLPSGSTETYYMAISYIGETAKDIGKGSIFNVPDTQYSGTLGLAIQNGVTTNVTVYPQLFDLTAMFGSTIADYIYSLETATPGAGVAWFRKLFPEDYYEYNPGELISVEGVSSHETVGFNQWDEELEIGSIDTQTGQNATNSTTTRSKNYIKIVPGTNYYTLLPWAYIFWYDANKNFIKYVENVVVEDGAVHGKVIIAPDNACYMRFRCTGSYGTTYKNDICINLSDPTRNGTYEPYTKHSYPLDSSLTLRGIPKLDANNQLYYDGDTYESDGTVTRKIKEIEVTACGSVGVASTGARYATYSISPAITELLKNNFLSNAYGFRVNAPDDGGKWFRVAASTLFIFDERFTDKSTADTILASEKPHFVYEPATPTTETATSFQSPQVIDEYGTEEYVYSGTRDVAIPVGHVTRHADIYPISGFDGLTVEATGKNLWNGTLANNVNVVFETKTGQTYTISAKRKGTLDCYLYLNASVDGFQTNELVGRVLIGQRVVSLTFTAEAGKEYALWSNASYTEADQIQIELGSSATSYEPYTGSTTPISWADEAGTVYGGYLEWMRDGTVRVVKTHEMITLNGSEYWGGSAGGSGAFIRLNSLPRMLDYRGAILCDQLPTSASDNSITAGRPSITGYRDSSSYQGSNWIYLLYPSGTTNAEVVAQLKANPVTVVYKLATPVTYTLTPQEALRTLRGTNNVWNDINDTTVTYWTHKTGDSV